MRRSIHHALDHPRNVAVAPFRAGYSGALALTMLPTAVTFAAVGSIVTLMILAAARAAMIGVCVGK